MNERLRQLFESHFGEPVERVTPVNAHGSNRKLYRIESRNQVAIGVENEDVAENRAFLEFSRHFKAHGLPVPEIYAQTPELDLYLEEDLGDQTLFAVLEAGRTPDNPFPEAVEGLYEKVVCWLPEFQIRAGRTLNYRVCYPRQAFDRQSMLWDLNYFKYYFLKLAQIPFNEQALEDDFTAFIDYLLQAERDYFLYRDFQSRNIMIRVGEPFFIDYQGGRKGALQYDIASLLFDAKADLPFEARERLLARYLEAVAQQVKLDREAFFQAYPGYALIRILQAMGAYGFRGFYERKTHFLQSVPYAIRNLEYVLKNMKLPVALPALVAALQSIVRSTRLRELGQPGLPLTVRIQSFSYQRGLPADETGHGGGFVFDCRCLPNPGRLDPYKHLTGNDPEVIAFLDNQPEVQSFLTRVRDLLSQVVENYLQRNFSHLSVAFGCTGGQHRSVYCANKLAEYLRGKYSGVKVEVLHREAHQWPGAEA